MELDPLLDMQKELEESGKDKAVLTALKKFLQNTEDINRQIDLVGRAHLENWLPNRKRPFWENFDIAGSKWIDRCVKRIYKYDDLLAVCALLNCPVSPILSNVQTLSPDLATVWDIRGAMLCGLGLTKKEGKFFNNYFYVGWNPGHLKETAVRIEYIRQITPPGGFFSRFQSKPRGKCTTTEYFWAELPRGFGHREQDTLTFNDHEKRSLKPPGHTRKLRQELGFK